MPGAKLSPRCGQGALDDAAQTCMGVDRDVALGHAVNDEMVLAGAGADHRDVAGRRLAVSRVQSGGSENASRVGGLAGAQRIARR